MGDAYDLWGFNGKKGDTRRRLELQFIARVGLCPDASGEAVRDIIRRGAKENLFFSGVTVNRGGVSVDLVIPDAEDTDEKMCRYVDRCREEIRWILIAVEERWPLP